MHIITGTRKVTRTGISLYNTQVTPTNWMKSLGVWIDHGLGFKIQAAAASSKLRQQSTYLWRIMKRKGASLGAPNHLTHTATLPAGSEVWWTGTRHIIDQVAPTNNTLARFITGLPKWTPLRFLLGEAGLHPLDLLLDQASQRYGIRIHLSPDDHPCKEPLLYFLGKNQKHVENGTGLQRIVDLLKRLTKNGPRLEKGQPTA